MMMSGAKRKTKRRGGTNHVHNRNTGFVECIDGRFGGHTNSTDEEGGLLLDNDLDELW
jgi:hypothetical protein